jgi:hypothetical protein
MGEKGVLFDNAIAQQMLLDDLLNHVWRGAVIPHAVRINQQNRV